MMYHRIKRAITKITVSILASIAYRIESFREHYQGPDMMRAIEEYDNALRSKIKYTDDDGSFEEARDMLWDEMSERNIKIWD